MQNIKEIVAKRDDLAKKVEAENELINDYFDGMVKTRNGIASKVENVITDVLNPLKAELSQIESDISRAMTDAGLSRIDCDETVAQMPEKITARVVDWDLLYHWIAQNEEIKYSKNGKLKTLSGNDLLKRDINSRTFKSLVDDAGIIPDGCEVQSFLKLEFKSKKEKIVEMEVE